MSSSSRTALARWFRRLADTAFLNYARGLSCCDVAMSSCDCYRHRYVIMETRRQARWPMLFNMHTQWSGCLLEHIPWSELWLPTPQSIALMPIRPRMLSKKKLYRISQCQMFLHGGRFAITDNITGWWMMIHGPSVSYLHQPLTLNNKRRSNFVY